MKLNLSDIPATNLSTDNLNKAFFENQLACYKTMLAMHDAKFETETTGIQMILTKRNSYLFNMAFPTSEITKFDVLSFRRLRIELVDEKIPFCLEFDNYVPNDIHELIRNERPKSIVENTSVIYFAKDLVASTPPPELKIKSVNSNVDLNTFLTIMETVWPDIGELKLCFDEWMTYYGYGAKKNFQSFLLLNNNAPVGIGSLHFSHGIVSVFNIAVLPSHQKQGLGHILMTQLIQIAKEQNYLYFAGSGSPEGMHLYKKFPIQTVGKSIRYIF